MKSCASAQTEALFRLAEQTDDPEAFLDEMIDIASRMLRGERLDDEGFAQWPNGKRSMDMSNLQIFKHAEFGAVRTVEIDGEPWLVGKDVAQALGYSNPQKAIRDHVDEDDKTVNDSFTVNGTQAMLINESGLHSLVLSSKLPGAKKFKRWVTGEVLPAIRKTGGYIPTAGLSDSEIMARALLIAQKSIDEKNIQIERQAQKIETDAPKVLFADSVAASHTSILVSELAKLLRQNGVSIGPNRLFDWLRENGYLIRRRGTEYNMPTQRSMELGLFEIKENAITHSDGHITVSKTPKVTGKGQQYFISKFLGGAA